MDRPGIRLIAGIAAIFSTLGCISCAAGDPFTSTALNGKQIPLTTASGKDARPSLLAEVTVAGGPVFEALVDTGSPGLRVFAGKQGSAGLDISQSPITTSFEDGTTFNGVAATAPVTIAGLPSAGPINIQLVESVSCTAAAPACAGAGGMDKLAADQGFSAILGIGLMNAEVFSPLVQLEGGPPATFTLEQTGTGTGMLTLNVTAVDPTAAFTMAPGADRLPNGVPSWNSNHTSACWSFQPAAPACLATAFDSGSPYIFTSPEVPGSPAVGAGGGSAGKLALYATASDTTPIWSPDASDRLEVLAATNGRNSVNTGLSIFADHAITFDIAAGRILLSP